MSLITVVSFPALSTVALDLNTSLLTPPVAGSDSETMLPTVTPAATTLGIAVGVADVSAILIASLAVNIAFDDSGAAAAAFAFLLLNVGAPPTPLMAIDCPVTAFKQLPPVPHTSTLPWLVVIKNWLSLKFTVNSVPRMPMVATVVFSW